MTTIGAGATTPPPLPLTFPERRRITRALYHRMAECGLIEPEAHVELLNGEIVDMSPIGPRHLSVTDKLTHFFVPRVGDAFICRNQGSQATSEISEPEPDFQLLRARDDFYSGAHPTADEVALVVEVAQSSLRKDVGPKMRIYAAAGIPEYWVVDLVTRQVIVHLHPERDAAEYREVTSFDDTATIAPVAAPDCRLDLGWLLGPREPLGE